MRIRFPTDRLVLAVDLLGTFVFALEGANAAVLRRLDFFGVLVLAFVTALGGGILRDVLIGAVPPASLRDRRYALLAFFGGAVVFFLHPVVRQVSGSLLIVVDAAGLGLFAVSGAAKALDYAIDPFFAVLLGGVTGVGGGCMGSVLQAQVPAILRTEIYAVAALAGAALMVVGIRRGLPRGWMMLAGGLFCFLVRVVSVWQHWNLPTAPLW